jgi:hypothetical protein
MKQALFLAAIVQFSTLCAATAAFGQGFGPRPPEFDSAEVSDEKKITFRIHAPRAEAVRLLSGDLPINPFAGIEMKKADKRRVGGGFGARRRRGLPL